MATYNGEKYLKEQLNSLVDQTYQNFELLIQDDCSTDKTIEIIETYKNKLNFHIIKNDYNLGYHKNFELVCKRATGDFIALCDQDDIWKKDKLQLLIDNIKNVTLVYSNSLLVDEKGTTLNMTLSQRLKNTFISGFKPLSFISDNCVSAHSMLFKKELLTHIFPFPSGIFFDAWIALNASTLDGILYLDKELVHYRQHDSNTLSNHNKKRRKIIQTKADKKLKAIQNKISLIDSLLKISTLSNKQIALLLNLKKEYLEFKSVWFNKTLFKLLKNNSDTLYAISNKNMLVLSVKNAIGYKAYRALPFL